MSPGYVSSPSDLKMSDLQPFFSYSGSHKKERARGPCHRGFQRMNPTPNMSTKWCEDAGSVLYNKIDQLGEKKKTKF